MPNQQSPIIRVVDLVKNFFIGTQDVKTLRGISFDIFPGEFVVILGPSGCGKSTLLHSLLGLEPPTSGQVYFLGKNLYDGTSEDERSSFRKDHIGMVYQQANWVKSLNVIENVMFPLLLLGVEKEEARTRALDILKKVNLHDWANYRPTELSGGQQQRIALSRALMNDPAIIIADEPTGNLDYSSGLEVMQLLSAFHKDHGKTIIMVTHDLEYVKYADTVVHMHDGQVTQVARGNEVAALQLDGKTKRGVDSQRARSSPRVVDDKNISEAAHGGDTPTFSASVRHSFSHQKVRQRQSTSL